MNKDTIFRKKRGTDLKANNRRWICKMWNTKWKCGKINIRKELCEPALKLLFCLQEVNKVQGEIN